MKTLNCITYAVYKNMKCCILLGTNDLFIVRIKCRIFGLVFKQLQIIYFYIFIQPKFLQKQIIWIISGLLCVCMYNIMYVKLIEFLENLKQCLKKEKNKMLKKYNQSLTDFSPSAPT